ncbi:MAG TPA: ATP-binding protein [Myxococcota bacterium]|nr:ATP-binding protein [Myxococcota bacterium]
MEALLILLVCGSVGVGWRVVRRSESPATWWMAGWVAAGAGSILALLRDAFPLAQYLAFPLGSLFAALLLAGACALARRPNPRWLLPVALVYGGLRAAVAAAGHPQLAWEASLVFEPPVVLASAWLVQRATPKGASRSERLLAPSLVVLAVLGAVHVACLMQTTRIPPGLLAMWVVGVPPLLGVQLHAEWERSRRALQRAHDELERRVEERTAELRETEARFFEAQRLESLAVLTGGVAHDFNNLLVVILGNSRAALAEAPQGSALQARLSRVRAAAEHGARLTEQMLAYTGKSSLALKPIDLSHLALEMTDLLHASVSERCRIELELAPRAPAEGDGTQLQQVLLNLVTNASEALDGREGRVIVRTGCADADAFLEVEDDGPGMDAATRQRIFEPFFTTKFSGRGLGLAAVQGIVRAHRGVTEVWSEPGQGTRIRVRLPLAPGAQPPRAASAGAAPARRGTVLVVDDQESVVEVAQLILQSAGHRVLTALGGRAGIETFRAHATEIDAVLLDLSMPDADGEQVLAALQRERPDVRVIVATGYGASVAAERVRARVTGFVHKPYAFEEMLAEIDRALAG